MLPIADAESRILIGVSQDERPPPQAFAEFFGALAHVAHGAMSEVQAGNRADFERRYAAYVSLALGAKSAQVFEFGRVEEEHLKKEAVIGGDLMAQKVLRPPYDACLYWYTTTGLKPMRNMRDGGVTEGRYATLVVSYEDYFLVADFIHADPEWAAVVRGHFRTKCSGTMLRELESGRHIFLLSAVGQIYPMAQSPTGGARWNGYIIDCVGEDRTEKLGISAEELQRQSLGSLADGVSAMTTVLTTKGIGIRREAPPPKVNAKREKHGRHPYPTITYVDARTYFEAMVRSSLGGTHASPVPHLRRGHPRHYSDGRKTWVRSCLVNCRSLSEAQERDHYEVKV